MPSATDRFSPAATGCRWVAVALACAALAACGRKAREEPADGAPQAAVESAVGEAHPGGLAVSEVSRQLASARVEAARLRLQAGAPDEALALLAAALEVDPGNAEAAADFRQVLAVTLWNLPAVEISHRLPVRQLAWVPPNLWVGLGDGEPAGISTVVRWDIEDLQVQAVMFPGEGPLNGFEVGPQGGTAVVRRGMGGQAVDLLVAAETLRPVCALEPLPAGLVPQAVTATTANGLLIARPAAVSADDPRIVWRIRDAATGGILRESDPAEVGAPAPVAAQLDTKRLVVLRTDGSVWEMPVSPVEPVVEYTTDLPGKVLQARWDADGTGALLLLDRGPGLPPLRTAGTLRLLEDDGAADPDAPEVEAMEVEDPGAEAPRMAVWTMGEPPPGPAWWDAVPWVFNGSWWDHLLRDLGDDWVPAAKMTGRGVVFGGVIRAPIDFPSGLNAAVLADGEVITGDAAGEVRLFRALPLPEGLGDPDVPHAPPDPAVALQLAMALGGVRHDAGSGRFVRIEAPRRREIVAGLDVRTATSLVPGLDLSATIRAAQGMPLRVAPAAALLPLWDRLARADRTRRSWPRWLQLAQDLGDTRWHQDLSEALARQGQPGLAVRSDDPSPWLAQERVAAAIQAGDEAAALAAVKAAGGKGPSAATALARALMGDSPGFLESCLAAAADLPPLLRTLGESRLAWLQKRPADAVSRWPEAFPDFAAVRQREDWDGWEQANFAVCYEAHLRDLRGELATYQLRDGATAEERVALAARLLDPATRGIIGRRRLADYGLRLAQVLVDDPERLALAVELAARARALGGEPQPCLRAEALALTRLQQFGEAHARWLALLTDHPVATHRPDDYAEAAYTAFETGDPNQAVEILTAGVQRFPDDAGFSLRAGWIALLTANYGRGYQFLLNGLRVGYPEAQQENANLLMTVAASLAGFAEDAATHYFNLVEMEPAWEDPATVDALEWPEELKQTLRGLLPVP